MVFGALYCQYISLLPSGLEVMNLVLLPSCLSWGTGIFGSPIPLYRVSHKSFSIRPSCVTLFVNVPKGMILQLTLQPTPAEMIKFSILVDLTFSIALTVG